MTKKEGKRPRRVVLRGYSQIRAFFREMGFTPPPHEATLYKWARHKGCPIQRAMGGNRVASDAKALAAWIRNEYFGSPVGKRPETTEPDRDITD